MSQIAIYKYVMTIAVFLVGLSAQVACGQLIQRDSDSTPTSVQTPKPQPSSVENVQPLEKPHHSFGHKLLWYVPNRLMDLTDIFRLRVRLGLGGALNFRMTDSLSFYGGSYRSAWLGLPGPRRAPVVVPPYGKESLKGLIVAGVDATDDSPHHPNYRVSETVVGGQLVIVGGDIGFDLIELVDFAGGLVFMNNVGDDF